MTYQRDNFDPNLNNIHAAMDYNSLGQPVLRVIGYGGGSGGTMDLTALSVFTDTATGGGTLQYNNTNGVFTFLPADLSHYATETYVSNYVTNAFENYNDLGNLSVVDPNLQNILGSVVNGDIGVTPNGTGFLKTPRIKIPTLTGGLSGSIVTGDSVVELIILNQQLANGTPVTWSSPGDVIPADTYGNSVGISHPYTVYTLDTDPATPLLVGDVVAGTGVPVGSSITWVGTLVQSGPGQGDWRNIIVTNLSYYGITTAVPPAYPLYLSFVRPVVNAGLSLLTDTGVDITLNAGVSGSIISHSNILPYTTNSFYLGLPTKRWKGAYFGPATIYIQDAQTGLDIGLGGINGNLQVEGTAGFGVGGLILRYDTVSTFNTAADISLGITGDTGTLKINRNTVLATGKGLSFTGVSGVQTVPYLGTATVSQIGGVQPDGTTIVVTDGIISAVRELPSQTGHSGQYLKTISGTLSWADIPNAIVYRGVWNPNTNTPTLTDGVGTVGDEYVAIANGSWTFAHGVETFLQSDFVFYNGTIWERVPTATVGVTSIQFDGGGIQQGVVHVVSSDIISTLDSGSIDNIKLANSSITVTAGAGLTGGGSAALGQSVTLSNSGVLGLNGSTYINVSSGQIPTVSLQQYSANSDANTIAIRDNVGGLNAGNFTATQDISILTDHGAFNYGRLNYTDTGIMVDFSSASAGTYNQIIIQNTSGTDQASTNYIVSNDQGTKNTNYGEFGMNSSGFTGTGSLNLPSAVYLNSISTDLALGGIKIHFATNGSTTDALLIDAGGTAIFTNQITGSISGSANNVRHSVTFNTTGGASANTVFDGSSAVVVDYHTVGAQAPLVSGTNIKTVNSTTLLGSGDVAVQAVLVSGTNIKTVNSNSLLGSGNISVGTVTSVAALTIGTTGTDITSSVATGTTTPVITLNVPTASASNRGALSSSDWTTFYNKQATLVSGNNIVTINGNSLLGSGNINVGTVTSISTGTNNVSGITLSGGPITSSGTVSLSGSISGLTTSNLSASANIANTQLANYTISGVALGSNLYNLTAGTNVTFSTGTTYNGSAAITINVPTGAGYTLPTAGVGSGGTLGGVKVDGTSITVSSGVISAVIPNYGVGGNQLVYELNAPLSLSSVKNTLISLFGLTSGVALQSNTRYQYEIVFNLACNKNGILSYALALNGGAVVAQHNYQVTGNKTATVDGYTAGVTMMSFNATGIAITTANPIQDINVFGHTVIYGIIDVTTAGSINFMISQDQNTPTWSVLAGAYVKLLPLGAIGANTVAGTWA